jgi:acyl-CoA thioesterase-1
LLLTLPEYVIATQLPDRESRTILVVGDSISAAYGMDLEQGWVAKLQQRLDDEQLPYNAVNASISGDTTAGGLRRLAPLLLEHRPAVVIIELGGNDGLRGYPIAQMRQTLAQMVNLATAEGAQVLLLGMEIPPNLGSRYTQLFRNSFAHVAQATSARATPFILDGIATNSELMQADGIHPTAKAQAKIVANVWPALLPLLEES